MEALMKASEKRECASLLPYRKCGDEYEFYLQKRETTRKVLPGVFAMFGGELAMGETCEEGLVREIEEELMYSPVHAEYFSRYEYATSITHVFIEEVRDDFESLVRVCEGEYGTFFPFSRIDGNRDIAQSTHTMIAQAHHYLVTRAV